MNHPFIITITGVLLLAAALFSINRLAAGKSCVQLFANAISAINITPKGRGTALADNTFARRYLIAKMGSDTSHIDLCGASDTPWAIVPDMTPTTDTDLSYPLPFEILALSEDTQRGAVNAATAVGDLLTVTTGGLLITLPTAAGTYWVVGRGKTATSAQYDLVEFAPCAPYQVTVGGIAGYTAGAGNGGAVTQITSSATGVTLNTPAGQITTVALTTAAAAEERFTVTNSAITAKDTVSLGTTYNGAGTPMIGVLNVAAGSFDIVITNLHASAALNALMVINYAIVKGATT